MKRRSLLVFALMTYVFSAWAGTSTIHTFSNTSSGIFPLGPLTADAQGNLYGTTFNGGIPGKPTNNCSQSEGCGTVFKLTPKAGGGWTYSVIHRFLGSPSDGQNPTDSLTIDSAGNVFGTTVSGGITGLGGTVYELSPTAGGTYTERVIYSFTGSPGGTGDGSNPNSVILDSAGNLYGATSFGGSAPTSAGIVYKLSRAPDGRWTETILHSFGSGTDGIHPRSGLLLYKDGSLFGTTFGGGTWGTGTVFQLSASGETWVESFRYSFGPMGSGDGNGPDSSLISDDAGNLYGTTSSYISVGTVFEMQPSGLNFTEKIIHYFLNPSSGSIPQAPVVLDSAGNLYGTTAQGGAFGFGTVFKLIPAGSGWGEREVHSFTGGADGSGPLYGVIFGTDGKLYGATPYGGSAPNFNGFGVVFVANP